MAYPIPTYFVLPSPEVEFDDSYFDFNPQRRNNNMEKKESAEYKFQPAHFMLTSN